MNNDQYFHRTAVFTRKNNQVALADINNPDQTSPLDEWLGIVVSLADGQHTIKELMDYMASRYSQPPENLFETIESVVKRLEEGNIVQLSDKSVELPYYLASPIEELDLEKARQLIKENTPT